ETLYNVRIALLRFLEPGAATLQGRQNGKNIPAGLITRIEQTRDESLLYGAANFQFIDGVRGYVPERRPHHFGRGIGTERERVHMSVAKQNCRSGPNRCQKLGFHCDKAPEKLAVIGEMFGA